MQQKPFGNTCHSYPEVADRIGHLKFFSKGPKYTPVADVRGIVASGRKTYNKSDASPFFV